MSSLTPLEDLDPTASVPAPAGAGTARASRGRLLWLRLRVTPRFWIGAVTLGLLIVWALVGTHLSRWSTSDQDLSWANTGPSLRHWFGTDDTGHDLYVQTVSGLGKSLVIGLVAGPLSTLLSAIFGSIAGYRGGRTDAAISWLINLLLVVPVFFILLLLSPVLKSLSWFALIPFIALFGWMIMAQVVRGQTKSLRDRDFVKAARFMGVSTATILRRHIIPNLASLLIIDATLGVGWAVMTETALSYFGFGIQPPQTSLGTLLASGTDAATTQPWVFLSPAVVLVVMLLAVSLIGDALRDAVDPTSGTSRD